MDDDIDRWSQDYTPDGGVINFYQLKDSLTAHIDQSEVDAVRPLVSFS
jgi:alkylated DNA repair protein alkB family protein 1